MMVILEIVWQKGAWPTCAGRLDVVFRKYPSLSEIYYLWKYQLDNIAITRTTKSRAWHK